MNAIVRVLIDRDGMSLEAAEEMFSEARNMIFDGYDPEEILLDYFGLEADYVFDLLW